MSGDVSPELFSSPREWMADEGGKMAKKVARKVSELKLAEIVKNFRDYKLRKEDDVKLHFYAEIMKPLVQALNPNGVNDYCSENALRAGGRTDATFQTISFEFKKDDYFRTRRGIDEALRGRDENDHGLFDYIINNAGIEHGDSADVVERKIAEGVGVGFDGKRFVFARFVRSAIEPDLIARKSSVKLPIGVHMRFVHEVKDLEKGLRKLALLVRQQDKISLTKQNVLNLVNPKNEFVRESIVQIYERLTWYLKTPNCGSRVRTLYKEWDRVFGIMYGNDAQATDFTEVSSAIRELYGIDEKTLVDSKVYLFSLQTFFNMFLKLLIYTFLSQLVDPGFSARQHMTKADIDSLFDGNGDKRTQVIANFFETHFLEWFTFTSDHFEEDIVNGLLERIDLFDLTSFVLKPENVQDILQEVYMELIPKKMRHLMGEYFSPDWIVEHALDMVGFTGDTAKSLIDPTAGSGPFLTQALKRVILKRGGQINDKDLDDITHHIVGFDINPISVVAAKANYILILLSAYCASGLKIQAPINIPVFIADSILAPVVYTEENGSYLRLKTSVGDLELPKFADFRKGNEFLTLLSKEIDKQKPRKELFIKLILGKKLITRSEVDLVTTLFDRLYVLHRSGQDSFWPIILRNSYAPIMIGEKFDFVVGNPPWIAWKSMSKSYREGTLKIWQSYGIFEKNAYDKKTTHDDFGMAVTYVAVDQYLKVGGSMVFLLPATFLKSTKGGEGFRKFEIIRNGQNIPFSVREVHDFTDVKLFTIPTSAIKFYKGERMTYPMPHYRKYVQKGGKRQIDTHRNWEQVSPLFGLEEYAAQPVDSEDLQSAWLTLKDMAFASKVLDRSVVRYYQGRKGIEPAGAKGVYILREPVRIDGGLLRIENDISRQRRMDVVAKGVNVGNVEETHIYPMLGGRNISKWKVRSCEFMIVPHTAKYKYGIPEEELAEQCPETFMWLDFYHDKLLETRIVNGKFFNKETNPFYRLDNVGPYTFAPYKVLWKEQSGKMAAVVVGEYLQSVPNANTTLFSTNKTIVVDSKVLMLGLDDAEEAYYVCGVINSRSVAKVIDGYAIGTNRGVDVLEYVAVPRYDATSSLHGEIADLSRDIHELAKRGDDYTAKECELDKKIVSLFS